jgi:hypothetical protein
MYFVGYLLHFVGNTSANQNFDSSPSLVTFTDLYHAFNNLATTVSLAIATWKNTYERNSDCKCEWSEWVGCLTPFCGQNCYKA